MRKKKQQPRRRVMKTTNSCTSHNHIHKHNPTWLPKTRMAKTHAYYSRLGQIHPDRKRLMKIKQVRDEQRTSRLQSRR